MTKRTGNYALYYEINTNNDFKTYHYSKTKDEIDMEVIINSTSILFFYLENESS